MTRKKNIQEEKKIFQFKEPEIFQKTGEIVYICITQTDSTKWHKNMEGEITRAVQIDFDSFLAIDHQDKKTPYIKKIVTNDCCKIVKNGNIRP